MGGKETKHQKLKNEEIELLISSTKLTRDQILTWHEEFISQFPDGKQNLLQFTKTIGTLFGNNPSFGYGKPEKFSKIVFDAFDNNKNNSIEFSEFMLAITTLSETSWDKKLHSAFKIYDLDRNNKIDKFELIKIMEALYDLKNIPESQRQGENSVESKAILIFKFLDKNNDNYLDEDEFVNGLLKNFEFISLVVT